MKPEQQTMAIQLLTEMKEAFQEKGELSLWEGIMLTKIIEILNHDENT